MKHQVSILALSLSTSKRLFARPGESLVKNSASRRHEGDTVPALSAPPGICARFVLWKTVACRVMICIVTRQSSCTGFHKQLFKYHSYSVRVHF